MCTPSTVEMYRVVNIDDPETYPGTFGFDNIDSIHVVSSLTEAELEASALENTDKKWCLHTTSWLLMVTDRNCSQDSV